MGRRLLIPYQIEVSNLGASTSPELELIETVPEYTSFSASDSTPGWQCAPGPGPGSRCSLAIDSLAPGETLQSVSFAARVEPGTGPLVDIFNEVELAERFSASSLDRDSGLQVAVRRSVLGELRAAWCTPRDLTLDQFHHQRCDVLTDCFWGAVICEVKALNLCEGEGPRRPQPSPVRTSGERRSSVSATEPLRLLLPYRLRDRVFRRTPGGRRGTELYYRHSAEVVRTMVTKAPGLIRQSYQTYLKWQPLIVSLVEGNGERAIIGSEHVQETLTVLDALKSVASPELLAVIEREEGRLDLASWVGLDMNQALARLNSFSCEPSDTALCLNGGRFRVEAEWQDFEGQTGRARAVPSTTDTGTFWFFDRDNVEVIVKVLDGRTINDRFWVYYGSLSNVEYTLTVTDTQTGAVRKYRNPSGHFASVGDTGAFDDNDEASLVLDPAAPSSRPGLVTKARRALEGVWSALARGSSSGAARSRSLELSVGATASSAVSGGCVAGPSTLCVGDGRFRVDVQWSDFAGNRGVGQSTPMTRDTGSFWFFDPDNTELVIKVLDGRAINGRFWVYYGALSDVEYTITVTDTVSGSSKSYVNPAGTFASRGDTEALPGVF